MSKTPVVTPEFRISYPNLFTPKKNKLNGKDEYSCTALFKKGADLSKLKAAAKLATEEKWGKDPKKWPANLRSPFRDQAEKAKEVDGNRVLPDGHEEGAIFMNFKALKAPGVVDSKVQDILDESEIYAGCYVRASVNVFAYDQLGNRGISFGLQNIQKLRDGEPLGTRSRPQDAFSPVETDGDATASDLFS